MVISATELIVETGVIGIATAANVEDGSDTDVASYYSLLILLEMVQMFLVIPELEAKLHLVRDYCKSFYWYCFCN